MPLPQAHLIALVAGTLLSLMAPRRLPVRRRAGAVAGAAVIAGAVALGSWAVASASRAGATLDRTDKLVRTGAFAVSRNPMYLAWSLGLLGLAVLMRSVWLLIGAAAAAMEVHREVLREEHGLERAFGDEYRAYRKSTRRYI